MRPTSLRLIEIPPPSSASRKACCVQTFRNGGGLYFLSLGPGAYGCLGSEQASLMTSVRSAMVIRAGAPLRLASLSPAKVGFTAKRCRHFRTVFSITPQFLAIWALLVPFAASRITRARNTRPLGAFRLPSSASNSRRIGGAMKTFSARGPGTADLLRQPDKVIKPGTNLGAAVLERCAPQRVSNQRNVHA